MPFLTSPIIASGLSSAAISDIIADHDRHILPRLRILWTYYRNPISLRSQDPVGTPGAPLRRPYRLGQERGLPARLVGASTRLSDDRTPRSCEIVVENDIAWRLHAMVDFMFGKPIVFVSTARNPALRRRIERALDAVWEASGGIALLHDAALLAHVYGHVDLIVRASDAHDAFMMAEDHTAADIESAAASAVRVEPIEPTRGMPILNSSDYRVMDAYLIRSRIAGAGSPAGPTDALDAPGHGSARRPRCPWAAGAAEPAGRRSGGGVWNRMFGRGHISPGPRDSAPPPGAPRADGAHDDIEVIEILGRGARQVYHKPAPRAVDSPITGAAPDDLVRLVEQSPNIVSPGRVPVVHIQNISQPFSFHGLSEVEPLIPLQDELNTRLSDRASRVTLQSFKMYLAKGLSGIDTVGIGPGQIWSTDNLDASVIPFGGDAASPSEDAHIEQIREAMDKASGVPPLASGVVRAKIGNLTSENALKVTLMGLLNKTARKRVTYGRALAEASRMILEALDRAGILATDPEDRSVRIEWPDPLPSDERQQLDAALRKVELGIPRERILSELGYAPTDPGVT